MAQAPMTPDSISRGLSPAQREAMLTITYDDWWRPQGDRKLAVIAPKLARAGLLDRRDVGDFGPLYKITPLGLAIREALKGIE